MSLVLALAIVFTTILGGCGKVDVEDITLSDKSVKLQLKINLNFLQLLHLKMQQSLWCIGIPQTLLL